MYMTDEEGEGVIPVPLATVEGGTLQVQLLNERRTRGLKYTKPSMEETNDEKLTYEMREFLLANMNGRLMIHEVV